MAVRLGADRAIREALLPALAVSIAEVAGRVTRMSPLVPFGTATTRAIAAAFAAFLAYGWLVAHDDMLKIVHPCTIFNDEFEAKLQTSLLLGTTDIHVRSEIAHPCTSLPMYFLVHRWRTSFERLFKTCCCLAPRPSLGVLTASFGRLRLPKRRCSDRMSVVLRRIEFVEQTRN